MCLGGHLAFRCALDSRVKAAVCYFATDIHSATLGEGKKDDSLARAGDIKGELIMVSPYPCFLEEKADSTRSSARTTTMCLPKDGT
jgi:dienelactone hydrolase